MSTRADIIIKDKYQTQRFRRHNDGYPEGALPSLTTFMEWVRDGRIRDNVSQASGWLIMIGAMETNHIWNGKEYVEKESITEPQEGSMGWKVGNYEPMDTACDDAEYEYTLDLDAMTIRTRDIYANTSTTVCI